MSASSSSGRRAVEEAAGGSGKECLQAGEGGLSKLAEVDVLVGLEILEPGAEAPLVAAVRQRDTIFIGIEIARDVKIAAVVASGEADCGLRVRGGAAADDDGADRTAGEKSGDRGGGSAGGGLTGEEVSGAGVAKAGDIEQAGREDVGFFEAEDLLAEGEDVGAVGIRGGRGVVGAVVDGVDVGKVSFGEKV